VNKLIVVPLFALILIGIDLYAYQAFRYAFISSGEAVRKTVFIVYWSVTAIVLAGYFSYHFLNPDTLSRSYRLFILVGVFMHYFVKFFIIFFVFIDDIIRLGKLAYQGISSLFSNTGKSQSVSEGEKITRSEFLMKTALVVGSIPLISMGYGIISGAHDYRVRRKTIILPRLPAAFDGIRIGQISDIHSGSFYNKTAVKGGVEMLMNEKPDIIFFTGDLVNNESIEMKNWMDVFDKIKAPLGVFSTLGNHDYGDYMYWASREEKEKNIKEVINIHRQLGYTILMNENRRIRINGDEIALIGVENWGAGRFSKYGKLDMAYQGAEDAPVKLLLSHDPSHWDAQVRPLHPDIDMMFAGHTHGFQFGVEIGKFKWSPSQYAYKQWAGLYREGDQYLYVNRGFGFIGYPGRIGMPPELTIFELKRA
jgi:predicted MPP superfamily phosphohydrolase